MTDIDIDGIMNLLSYSLIMIFCFSAYKIESWRYKNENKNNTKKRIH